MSFYFPQSYLQCSCHNFATLSQLAQDAYVTLKSTGSDSSQWYVLTCKAIPTLSRDINVFVKAVAAGTDCGT